MTLPGFTIAEAIPYLLLMGLCGYILISNYRKGYREVWSPLTILAIIFGYYCLLGPYQAVSTGKTFDRLLNMRPYYASAFWGAFVALLFSFVGFQFNQYKAKRFPIYSDEDLGEFGKKISVVGFVLFSLSIGGKVGNLINPLNAEAVETSGGSFANYLSLSLNFLIPGVVLLFAYFIKTKKGVIWFIGFFVAAAGLFTTMGFRYRLVLLLVPMAIFYYLIKKKRPNLLVMIPGIFAFITIMGFIGSTRKYGRGLILTKDSSKQRSYYVTGLDEALIFQTSGAIIDLTPERIPHSGFTPLISTLLFPIPSSIYKDKNSAEYVLNALDEIYGSRRSKGAAFLNFAEYYLAFGWLGIVIGSFIMGWFFKRLWNWYLANEQNPFVIATYGITVSYLYVIISRGYLPQVTMLFFFSVYPVWFAWGRLKGRYKKMKIRKPVFRNNQTEEIPGELQLAGKEITKT